MVSVAWSKKRIAMVLVRDLGILGLAFVALYLWPPRWNRARDSEVKANMHSFQLAIEDFAVKNTGTYPTAADSVAVRYNMPDGVYPINPYTGRRDPWVWGKDPESPGIIGANPATESGYVIKGYGAKGILPLTLTNG